MFMGCCCAPCTIVELALTNLTGLTTVSGSPSASGGTLTLDSGEFVVTTASASDAGDGTHFITTADTADATATLRLVLAYIDADNYVFGQFSIAAGAGTIRVGEHVDGADNWLSDPKTITDTGTDLTDAHEVTGCWIPGTLHESQQMNSGDWLPEAVISSGAWSDPNNVLEDDANMAQWFMGGTAPVDSDELSVSFSIPRILRGSTIDGMKVRFNGGHDGTSSDVTATCTLTVNSFSDSKTPISVSSGTSDYDFGGPTDDWGFTGITAEDFNTGSIAVGLTFTDNDTATAQISVGVILLTVWFTTPDHRFAVIQFSLKNNGDNTYQCVSAPDVLSTGLKAGLASTAGTWTFTTPVAYSYHLSNIRPLCPECTCTVEEGDCNNCDGTTGPKYIFVEIQNVADDLCDDSEVINDLHTTELGNVLAPPCDTADCVWSTDEFPTCTNVAASSHTVVTVAITTGPPTITVVVAQTEFPIATSCPVTVIEYQLELEAAPDCFAFDGLEIPYSSQAGAFDASGSTCKLYSS